MVVQTTRRRVSMRVSISAPRSPSVSFTSRRGSPPSPPPRSRSRSASPPPRAPVARRSSGAHGKKAYAAASRRRRTTSRSTCSRSTTSTASSRSSPRPAPAVGSTPPPRWRRLPRRAAQGGAREVQGSGRLADHRRRRRPDRRLADALGRVPRRAHHRGHEQDGARRRLGRQPRVRRGLARAAADAERRLPRRRPRRERRELLPRQQAVRRR